MMPHPVLLVLDDDPAVLAAVGRDLLERYGGEFDILRAATAADALAELRDLRLRGAQVALLLADQRMPELTGVDFLRQARRLFPDAKRVLLTAWADTEAAIRAINEVALDHYLMKPWDPAEERLYPVLDDLLEAWRASAPPPGDGVRVVASEWSAEGHHVRDFLARNLVPYRWLDLERDQEAGALLLAASNGRTPALPLVVFEDGSMLESPSDLDLAGRMGLSTRASDDLYDVVIVGAGPAGLAAAVHAAAEGRRTLLVERQAPGGQAGLSARIENYLGFPVGLSGGELARRAVAQAKRFGAEIVSPVEAVGLRVSSGYPIVRLSTGAELSARALLIASGVQYRRLEVAGAERLVGAGVYYGGALTEAVRVSGRDVHVLGGGNSAAQAALHLARFAGTVTLLVRSERALTMSHYLRDRLEQQHNVRLRTACEIVGVTGGSWIEGVTVRERDGSTLTLPSFGLFVFIGASAHTDWLRGLVRLDERGFIYSGPDALVNGQLPPGWSEPRDPMLLETSVPGVFVAGDVRHRLVKGVAAAVGEGNMAAQLIHQYLNGALRRAPAPLAAALAT